MRLQELARGAVHVVAAALLDGHGQVLLAQRPPGRDMAGLWEFPGGKLEPGERRVDALRRELDEELGVEPLLLRPLLAHRHDYPQRSVVLDVWQVVRWRGLPSGREGQALAWVALAELPRWPMPAADRPVVEALRPRA